MHAAQRLYYAESLMISSAAVMMSIQEYWKKSWVPHLFTSGSYVFKSTQVGYLSSSTSAWKNHVHSVRPAKPYVTLAF